MALCFVCLDFLYSLSTFFSFIPTLKSLFDSVVAVAFQIAFPAKMHANDIFLFFKNHF
jgi:hypothetical protein